MRSIKRSVWFRVGIILIAILVSGFLTFFGLRSIRATNKTVSLATTLHTTALESEKAHYLFLENLVSTLHLNTDFSPKDYQSCVLVYCLIYI